MKNREIEKKYLIKYPSAKLLEDIPKELQSEITQTYLLSEPGVTARVRKRVYYNCTKYFKTEKIRISDMTAIEKESEISEEAYISELRNADPQRKPIEKRRLLLRSSAHTFEIDIYPFWQDRAIMEVELGSENEAFSIPKEIEIIRDVTGDRRYKNAALAKEIPTE